VSEGELEILLAIAWLLIEDLRVVEAEDPEGHLETNPEASGPARSSSAMSLGVAKTLPISTKSPPLSRR